MPTTTNDDNQLDPTRLAATVLPAVALPPAVGESAPGGDEAVRLDRLGLTLSRSQLAMPSGYCGRHVDCHLTRQAAAAKLGAAIVGGLAQRFEGGYSSHPAGSLVDRQVHFMRWLLDRVADELEQATGKSLVADFDLEFRT